MRYAFSFLVSFGLLVAGFLLELSGAQSPAVPSFPLNLILLITILGFVITTSLLVNSKFTTWIRSVPAAISAITVFAFLSLLMVFIPQEMNPNSNFVDKMGLNTITCSWPYILVSLYLIFSLGFVTVNRIFPFNFKNFRFFFNHAGLWIVLVSASLGSGDLKRLKMIVYTEDETNIAFNENNDHFKMPFTIQLNNFNIKEYIPELILYDQQGQIVQRFTYSDTTKPLTLEIPNYKICIKKYYSKASVQNEVYVPSHKRNAVHAMFIELKGVKDNFSGWISSGNYQKTRKTLNINEDYGLALAPAKAKSYVSNLSLSTKDQKINNIELEVNKPIHFEGWKIYQIGYDEHKGRWSDYTILELVRDPWLPAVYVVIIMLIIGSILLIWKGKQRKNNHIANA